MSVIRISPGKSMVIALIWIISLASILCMLIRPRGVAEAWWTASGALLLTATGLISVSVAGKAILKGVDVYLFLAGMMILSELARENGVFDWIAERAADHAGGSPRRLFLLIYLVGTVVTAFLSNDATAVVLTPAVLAIVRRLKAEPVPYLLACAFIANAASFLLPISNPANLVIFASHMPPLPDWLAHFFLPSVAAIGVTFAGLRFMHRRELAGKIETALPKSSLLHGGRLALAALGVAALTLITASACGWPLGLPTCGAALLALLVVAWHDRSIPLRVIQGAAWSVIPLVAGLFVIVEALQSAGMLGVVDTGLREAGGLSPLMGNLATAFSVGLLSNVMNNLPVGLIGGAAVHSTPTHAALAPAVLVGVDLGPNLSVTGSLATILWLIAMRREGVRLTGWQFLKVGLVVMPLSLLGAILVLR
jgi:arsenical pump membrane protein